MPVTTPPTSLSLGQFRVLQYLAENAEDGKCYRCVRQIAHDTKLSRSYVDQLTTQLVKLEIISREKMWKLHPNEEEGYRPRLVPEEVGRKWAELSGYDLYRPAWNMYTVLRGPEGFQEGYYVNIAEPAAYQLSLPFPPHEKTILARFTKDLDPARVLEPAR